MNRTAWAAGITPQATGEQWRLTLTGGPKPVAFDRAALTAMPQHTARLPIACVEGWSTTETWTGVPLRDLARFAGVPYPASAFVRSVERCGGFNRATLQALSVGLSGCIRLCLMVCDGSCLSMGNTAIWGAVSCDRGQPTAAFIQLVALPSEVIMTVRRDGKVGAWPSRDEITQAVKNLWTGDTWQHAEITVRVLGEVENIRAWNEKADP